jgi:hypothetical protein
MDGKLWDRVYQMVETVEHPENDAVVTHSDRTIVLVQLRAAADDRPVSWACRTENWIGLKPPPSWPSQPTVSRRLRTDSVQALYDRIWSWLKNQPRTTAASRTPAKPNLVRKVDGRALTINPFSKDPDARWGWALRGYGFGYKFHAVWGDAPVPEAWDLQPLNTSESRVAAESLIPQLPAASGKRYLIGDSAYDSNPLHAVAAERGYQLLAPPKRPGTQLSHRPHHPGRIAALEQLNTPYGKRLYRRRAEIEREFGHWALRHEGLDELPAHVRRHPRVKRFVHAKLILNGFRILLNHQALTRAAT